MHKILTRSKDPHLEIRRSPKHGVREPKRVFRFAQCPAHLPTLERARTYTQEGTSGSDWVTAATSTGDGTVVLAGTSQRVLQDPASTSEDFTAIELDVGWDLASGSGSGSGSGALAAAAAAAATPAPLMASAASSASGSVSVDGNGTGVAAGDGGDHAGDGGAGNGGSEAEGHSSSEAVDESSSASHSLGAGAATPTPTPAVAAAGGGQGGSGSSSSSSLSLSAPTPAPYAILAAPGAPPAEATRAPVGPGSTVRSPGLASDNDDVVGGSLTSGGFSLAPSFAGVGGGGGGGSVLLFCFAAACAVRRASMSMFSS